MSGSYHPGIHPKPVLLPVPLLPEHLPLPAHSDLCHPVSHPLRHSHPGHLKLYFHPKQAALQYFPECPDPPPLHPGYPAPLLFLHSVSLPVLPESDLGCSRSRQLSPAPFLPLLSLLSQTHHFEQFQVPVPAGQWTDSAALPVLQSEFLLLPLPGQWMSPVSPVLSSVPEVPEGSFLLLLTVLPGFSVLTQIYPVHLTRLLFPFSFRLIPAFHLTSGWILN